MVIAGLALLPGIGSAQHIAIPSHVATTHPRVATLPGDSQAEIRKLGRSDDASRQIVQAAEQELAPLMAHVKTDPMWLASRLQMYWKTHATEVYNAGDSFDHTDGHAPVATVRYPGSRNPAVPYRAPKLEDVPAYEDETKGVYAVNESSPGEPFVWVEPSKAGRIVDAINSGILRKAETAARLYWITGDEAYARFAFTVFDTYMRGMYYRHEPVDLNHGHSQTIYGMSTFEVIQEGVLQTLADTYDFLHDYIKVHDLNALPIYADTFRKWIDVTMLNGVPFNNWDLIQARFAINVALVLDDDSAYADRRGAEFYINQVLNEDSTRQWSLGKLAARGFDTETGIWFESPGYSMGVVNDFIALINSLDTALGTDLLLDLPIVGKAVTATAQYTFPNGYTAGWGDSHYGLLNPSAAKEMAKNGRMHHRREQEVSFTGMAKALANLPGASPKGGGLSHDSVPLDELFNRAAFQLDPSVPASKLGDLVTPTFSAPNVSYFVQRVGTDARDGLTIAEAGSLGNHQHANGITIELFGKGLVLAPDSGIGSNYFQADHNEYYAQFPAHNTVVVDGISSYPTMMSHHSFTVNHAYPDPKEPRQALESSVTFNDVSFLEPETNADQRRVMSIVGKGVADGYYVDIFRSHRRDGRDLKNDYFFHGLGQSLDVADAHGGLLESRTTEKLTFADEELSAYDYLYDKHQFAAASVYRAVYRLKLPNQPEADLMLWMTGGPGRVLFRVKSPPATGLGDMIPKNVAKLPLETLVMRQTGEAWDRPFVNVIAPSDPNHPSTIQSVEEMATPGAPAGFVWLVVRHTDGTSEAIFSNVTGGPAVQCGQTTVQATYAMEESGSEGTRVLFLEGGSLIRAGDGASLRLEHAGSALFRRDGSSMRLSSSGDGSLTLPAKDSHEANLVVEVPGGTALHFAAQKTTEGGKAVDVYRLSRLPISSAHFQ